jgi:hypothetical protein
MGTMGKLLDHLIAISKGRSRPCAPCQSRQYLGMHECANRQISDLKFLPALAAGVINNQYEARLAISTLDDRLTPLSMS